MYERERGQKINAVIWRIKSKRMYGSMPFSMNEILCPNQNVNESNASYYIDSLEDFKKHNNLKDLQLFFKFYLKNKNFIWICLQCKFDLHICKCLIPGSGRFAREEIGYPLQYSWASLEAQLVKNLPAMWGTWVRPLGWEDPLEKGKATHSSILAWRIP